MEVGEGDGVHVSDSEVPLWPSRQPHHGKVFEQLAADGASSHLPGKSHCSSPGAAARSAASPSTHPSSPPSTSGSPAAPGMQPRRRQSAHHSESPSIGMEELREHRRLQHPGTRSPSVHALTGTQSSSVSCVTPSSVRHSRASKYNHWSRGRNFPVMAWGKRGPIGPAPRSTGSPYPSPALLLSQVSPDRQQVPSRGHQTLQSTTSGTAGPENPIALTFRASWAATAPTTAATGHRSPALTLAKARTTSSSRGPGCIARLRASSSTRSASTCRQRGKGSPRQGGGSWEGGQGQDRDSPVLLAGAGDPAPHGTHAGPGRQHAGCGCAAAPRD